ncbi:MAG TPA: hypothetical protein VJ349_23450 [Stellaceae bacterium]|nr:hypothetical protein [Stellaceae bacterium]
MFSDANGEFQLYSAGSLRFRASSHRSGSSGLFTILRVKRFACMCGGSAFMTGGMRRRSDERLQRRLILPNGQFPEPPGGELRPQRIADQAGIRAQLRPDAGGTHGNQGMRQMLRSGKYESSTTQSRPGAARACDCHGDSDISRTSELVITDIRQIRGRFEARIALLSGLSNGE